MIPKICADCGNDFMTTRKRIQCCEICKRLRLRRNSQNHTLSMRSATLEAARKIKKTPRNCMKCKQKFMSDGKHNRMCSSCRDHRGSPYEN